MLHHSVWLLFDCVRAIHYLQQEAGQAVKLHQMTQQQLQNSRAAAKQSEHELQEQVHQLRRSSSDKENSLVQLQQRCQSTEIQLQVCNRAWYWQS